MIHERTSYIQDFAASPEAHTFPEDPAATTYTYLRQAALAGIVSKGSGLDAFRDTLHGLSEARPPQPSHAVADLGYALLHPESDPALRRALLNTALDSVRDRVLGCAAIVTSIDPAAVRNRAEHTAGIFTRETAQLAATYPARYDNAPIKAAISEVIKPGKPSPEDIAVMGYIGSELLRPYVSARLLNVNLYDRDSRTEQLDKLRKDMAALQQFYHSTGHAVAFSVTGESTISTAEIAERLFKIGPIFAKMGQSLTGMAKRYEGDQAAFVREIGRNLQEGVAKPSQEQQAELGKLLPAGYISEGVLSSASIAHVLKAHSASGTETAFKVKRPGIEQAIRDNVRTFDVVTDVTMAYAEAHAEQGGFTDQLDTFKRGLPFALHILERDVEAELDFVQEAASQQAAGEAFAAHPGVVVPKMYPEQSNDQRIAMEVVNGERIEDMPANQDYLKNLFVLHFKNLRRGKVHGDMHAGNIKAAADRAPGTIVSYDFGREVTLSRSFVRNAASLIWAFTRRKPEAIAKAYHAVQSPWHNNASVAEILPVARESLSALADSPQKGKKGLRKYVSETGELMRSVILTMGIRHQSSIDTDYVALMKSNGAFTTVVKNELAKPAYQKRGRKAWAVVRNIGRALSEIRSNR